MDKKLRTLLLPLLLFTACYGYAQPALLEKGDRLYGKKNFNEALKTYLLAYAENPESPEINFKVGITYLYVEAKVKAIPYLEKAYQLKPGVDPDIDYHLGIAYQNNHQYARAKTAYENFLSKNRKLEDVVNLKIRECIIGDSLSRHPIHVRIENAGSGINTPFHEYSPLVSGDGNTMIFTSNRSDDDYKVKSGTNFEDIYISYKTGGHWGAPQPISPNINIKFNDAAASLSHDGNTLFLYYEEGGGDIYTSTRDGKGWTKPVALNKNINTPLFWETSASISKDGRKLFFTSNRPGGKGELDIYVSELDSKGAWGKAVNLGPNINTPGHEDSPFIHPDGVTLYFSSDGHPTMGSNDIFKSEFRNDHWQKPVNIGYPVNSIEYDGFFTLSEDRKTGYYSALREDGLGQADIYAITFLEHIDTTTIATVKDVPPAPNNATEISTPVIAVPPVIIPDNPVSIAPAATDSALIVADSVKPVESTPAPHDSLVIAAVEPRADTARMIANDVVVPTVAEPVTVTHATAEPVVAPHEEMRVVTMLRGKVIDEKTMKPLDALITLVNNETNEIIARIKSNRQTGEFILTIPHGGNYGVATERPGYLFHSINFNVPQFTSYQEIDTHILMAKAAVGSIVVLKNVFFDIGKAELKTQSIAEVENLRELLERDEHLRVQINGHTDNTGNAARNKTLSLRRARSVVDYLIAHGINPDRLTAMGFGSERPIVSNDDEEEGREINRRTEIEIIE